jgi:hypothetical protein
MRVTAPALIRAPWRTTAAVRALAALVAAALLAPAVAAAPPRAPEVVVVSVGHDVATGFVAGDGLVVTVAHVLGPAVTVGGRRAVVLRADRRLDLAVLRVAGVEGERPRVGQARATVVRVPDGTRPAPTVRRIRARVDGLRRPALELRADVAAGDSGAPVVTPGGRLAGVVFARSRGRARTAYAVDATAVARFLDGL